MTSPSFVTELDPRYGEAVRVAPMIRRVVAKNPSKFTYLGTGTYLVGDDGDEIAIIDAGPRLPEHVDAVLNAVGNATVTHLLVTHTHGDHSPATADIKAATGATTYGFSSHPMAAQDEGAAERDDAGEALSAQEKQLHRPDTDFVPDVSLSHGAIISGREFTFEAIYTPGHISNHLCYSFREANALFSGDHVMGWSTTIIPPPDGDMSHYLASLRLLLDRDESIYYPTHGPPIKNPRAYVEQLLEHRQHRGRQILSRILKEALTIDELVAVIYADIREELHKPAARSVESHLIMLERDGLVNRSAEDPPAFCAK